MGIQDAKQAAKAAPTADEPTTAVATADAPPVPNYYCLNTPHSPRLVTVDRFIHFAGEVHPPGHPREGELVLVEQGPGAPALPDLSKAPVCPRCSLLAEAVDPITGLPRVVRVSAVPLEYDEAGNPQIPQAIREIAARAGETL